MNITRLLVFARFPFLVLSVAAACIASGCGSSPETEVTTQPRATVRQPREVPDEEMSPWTPAQQTMLNGLGYFDREAAEWVLRSGGKIQRNGNVLEIDLQNTDVSDADLRPLKFLESPVVLNASSLPIGDEGAKDLAGIPNIVGLNLAQTKITDDVLESISDAEHLAVLNLSNTAVTDRGVRWLRGLNNLNQLYLSNTAVTGRGIENMTGLEKLAQLDLGETRVMSLESVAEFPGLIWLSLNKLPLTDSDLAPLSKATKLKQLYLGQTSVGDGGLAPLRTLKELQMLDLSDTRTTDAGLRTLSGLPELQALNISDTKITDTGLESLTGLKKLSLLDVSKNDIGDKALPHLARLPLSRLGLLETKVSAEGVARFRNLRPGCQLADPYTVTKRDDAKDTAKLLPNQNNPGAGLKPKSDK